MEGWTSSQTSRSLARRLQDDPAGLTLPPAQLYFVFVFVFAYHICLDTWWSPAQYWPRMRHQQNRGFTFFGVLGGEAFWFRSCLQTPGWWWKKTCVSPYNYWTPFFALYHIALYHTVKMILVEPGDKWCTCIPWLILQETWLLLSKQGKKMKNYSSLKT